MRAIARLQRAGDLLAQVIEDGKIQRRPVRPAAYKAIVDQLATAIRSGDFPAGTKLPTHRALAADHRIALATATRVYSELSAMGTDRRRTRTGDLCPRSARA